MFNRNMNYYMQHSPRDERNRLAQRSDFIITLLFTWLLTILALQYLSLSILSFFPVSSAILNIFTLLLLLSELVLIRIISAHRQRALITHRDMWYSARKCRERIGAIGNQEEFIQLIMEILTPLKPFSDIKRAETESGIDIVCRIGRQKIGVKCINTIGLEQKEGANQVRIFFSALRQLNPAAGYTGGLVMSSGLFNEEAKRFVRKMNGKLKIFLIDGYGLLRLAKSAKHPIFTIEEWQQEKDIPLSGKEVAISIKENVMASRKRSLLFVYLGMVFLVIAAWQNSLIGAIYLICGVIALFIGLTGYILVWLRRRELRL